MQHPPDLWRASGSAEAVVLFDMARGIPARNVLGLSDPDVHLVDGRWTMFLGGFTTRFRVAIFRATLPPGAPIASTAWSLVTDPRDRRYALQLVDDPPRGAWDRNGMHAPAYVRAVGPDGASDERIYYAGRSSAATTGPRSRYAIGCLRRTPRGWVRHGPPVHVGTARRPSVLEPLVRFEGGVWHMWYLSAIGEVGRGELPDYRIEHTTSEDGLRWGAPHVLFTGDDGFFDADVRRVGDGYTMIVARGTNLYATPEFPPQGLWLLRAAAVSGDRSDWSAEPMRVLDTDVAPRPWFAAGACGPSLVHGDTDADADAMYVFFTGTAGRVSWWRRAASRLLRGRCPPVPAPYYLATGRITVRCAPAR